jgi:hypothetical protein
MSKEVIEFFSKNKLFALSTEHIPMLMNAFQILFDRNGYINSFFSLAGTIPKPQYNRAIIYKNCLCAFRYSGYYKTNTEINLNLLVPPVSLDGNKNNEVEVLNLLTDYGISANLSVDDLEYFNIDRKGKYIRSSNMDDYIYDSEILLKLEGKDFANIRNQRNKYNRLLDEGYLKRVAVFGKVNAMVRQRVLDNYDAWAKRMKEKNYHIFDKPALFIENYNQYATNNVLMLDIYNKEFKSLGTKITQRLTDTFINDVYTIRNYELRDLDKPTEILMVESVSLWNDKINKPFLINYGCATGGLAAQKEKYNPVKIVEMYKNHTNLKNKGKLRDFRLLIKDIPEILLMTNKGSGEANTNANSLY